LIFNDLHFWNKHCLYRLRCKSEFEKRTNMNSARKISGDRLPEVKVAAHRPLPLPDEPGKSISKGKNEIRGRG
jgi:hypothetical protein